MKVEILKGSFKNAKELQKAYRKLALIHHPDKPTGNEEKFKQLANEYQFLKSSLSNNHSHTFTYRNTSDGDNNYRARAKKAQEEYFREQARREEQRFSYIYQGKSYPQPKYQEGMRMEVYYELKRLWVLAGNHKWNPYAIYHRYVHFILTSPNLRMLDIRDFYCLNSIFNYREGWCYVKLHETRDKIMTEHCLDIDINEKL